MGIFDNVNDDPLLAVTNDLRTLVQKLDSRVKALEKGSTAGASATPAAATANDDDVVSCLCIGRTKNRIIS